MAPSDYEAEERINDSILFSEFLNLDMGVGHSGSQHHQPLPLRAHTFRDYG